jgi:hypothetical protein
MKTKQVKPFGMLYANSREYFALAPIPEVSEDWEWDDGQENVFRFLVTPHKNTISDVDEFLYDEPVYSFARHIVTNNFTLEYADMPEITIRILDIGD